MALIRCVIISVLIKSITSPPVDNFTELSIIHINDFHARYEEITLDSGLCKSDDCIGGFSRLYATVNSLLQHKPNSILLNAGDNFEGTPWYDIHKWNVTQYFLNKLPTDAFTLGNHEFEDKIAGLVPFLQHLKAPVVVANIDASKEPSVQNLIKKSVIVERSGKKIGVIGVVLSTITEIADVGNLVLLDEFASVNAEAERLVKEEGVFTNIVLSHCGYDVEQEIAKRSGFKISMVVGGHSHSFLYTKRETNFGTIPGPDLPVGPYPTIVKSNEDKTVLVVQASSYTKYLGNITVRYDKNGEVVDWTGAPVFLDNVLPQDNDINKELISWKEVVDSHSNPSIGTTLVRLEQATCPTAECLLGNFITDAMVFGYMESPKFGSWTRASIALTHGGGLRSGIDAGNITYNEIVSAQPFNNTIDLGEIKGKDLKEILESSTTNTSINLLQVAGMHVVYDLKKPQGSRVTSLKLRCQECMVPTYEDLQEDKIYKIILPSFLAGGGFGFGLFKKYLQNHVIGELDIDLFVRYISSKSPIFEEIEGRIIILR